MKIEVMSNAENKISVGKGSETKDIASMLYLKNKLLMLIVFPPIDLITTSFLKNEMVMLQR